MLLVLYAPYVMMIPLSRAKHMLAIALLNNELLQTHTRLPSDLRVCAGPKQARSGTVVHPLAAKSPVSALLGKQ